MTFHLELPRLSFPITGNCYPLSQSVAPKVGFFFCVINGNPLDKRNQGLSYHQVIAKCGDVNTTRAQTAYIQGNGPKMIQGMVSGTMGGLELSDLTVFWKIIARLKRQNPVRRVRKLCPMVILRAEGATSAKGPGCVKTSIVV